MKFYFAFGFTILVFLSSCICRSDEYRQFYCHLQKPHPHWQPMVEEEYFLIILVDAKHLDYTDTNLFLHSIAKHPRDGGKNGDFGHAWIYLQGKRSGRLVVVEGGHSGEWREPPARYFDGIMNYNECGYANPMDDSLLNERYEPNPIRYLWYARDDGYFQKGAGGHVPSYAAKISLTSQQFERILDFIHPRHYPYQSYALLSSQCCTFVTQIAALAGLQLDSEITMNVAPFVYYRKSFVRLWENPFFSSITFASPDMLEKKLIEAVENGYAEYALDWYLAHRKKKSQ